jgi:Tfp pilus assembly protein PilF
MTEESAQEQLLELANFYFLNSKFEEAEIEFYKVLEKDPKCWQAYCSLGLIYEERQDFVKAKQMYDKTLELNKENKVAKEHISKITGMNNE